MPRPSPLRPRTPPDEAAAAALRPRLEQARLDLRALFLALDQLNLTQNLPEPLRLLFELDADFAEALCVLDQPSPSLNWAAMTRDTLESLEKLDPSRRNLLESIPSTSRKMLIAHTDKLRPVLGPEDAYRFIPGRDPHFG